MTRDVPAPGLAVWQPRRGFRYGAEAFWLVGFALEPGPVASAIDLGTGSGIAAALLAGVGVDAEGYDTRPEWAPLWERTLADSRPAGRLELAVRDVLSGGFGPAPLVVSNPPFFPSRTGPVAPDPWRAAARTESTATLADFARASLEALAPGGRACFVVPADRGAELVARGHAWRIVHVGRRRVLVELRNEPAPRLEQDRVAEADERVRGWYRLARGDGT